MKRQRQRNKFAFAESVRELETAMMQVLRRAWIVPLLLAVTVLSFAAEVNNPNPNSPSDPNATQPNNQISIDKVEPSTAARGESVTVSGNFPSFDKVVVQLQRRGWSTLSPGNTEGSAGASGTQPIEPEIIIKDPKTSFSFVVPFNLPLGQYQVSISFGQKNQETPAIIAPMVPDGTLHIISRTPVKVTSVSPDVSYSNDKYFEFRILGEGFSPVRTDNALVIEGQTVIPTCPDINKPMDDCVNGEASDNGRELRFWNIPRSKYLGKYKVGVRVGDQYGDKTVEVTLARVGRKWPAAIAVSVVLSIAVLILWILKQREKAVSEGKVRGRVLSAIFLDPETNTYSLSKTQFYAWTAAAVFGYVYLTISKSWVQSDFTFADIPDNLPGIIFVAATTTAVAVGITSAKGSKGSGELNPSLADLVSSGGVIAAERLQFVVWTIIGIIAFIALTLSIEPGHIKDLPPIPEKFLLLMGISSFGYLGGKLARKPGPVISKIEAETGSLTLTIQGSNLSPDATFKIDDVDVPANCLNNASHPDGKPQVVETSDQPGFAKVLRLVIEPTDAAMQKWITGPHNLTLTNPDGQKAVSPFTASPPQQTPTNGSSSNQPQQPNPGGAGGSGASSTPTTNGPTISEVIPSSGSSKGGAPVTISGTNFGTSAAVTFGGTPAVSVSVLSATTIIAQSPQHAPGAVDLMVQTSNGGTVTSASGYTYTADAP